MSEHASIPRRIASLKRLAREYYDLPDNALIEKHNEVLRVFDVRGSRHNDKHPHKMTRVYISRMALKHFVEQRRKDLSVRHTPAEAIERICVALDEIQETITNFDKYEYEPDTNHHFYTRDNPNELIPSLRILAESKNKDTVLEIVSIHFKSRRKTKTPTVKSAF